MRRSARGFDPTLPFANAVFPWSFALLPFGQANALALLAFKAAQFSFVPFLRRKMSASKTD